MTTPFYTEDHEAFRALVREFVEKELSPHVKAWDDAREFPRAVYEQAGALGVFGIGFDEVYGGLGKEDPVLRFIVQQEFARCGAGGVAAGLLGSFYISQPPIQRLGSEALKARILPETIAGRKIGALCITEPGTGSDVARITTRADRDGDHYVLNGSKTFITSGMRADVLTVAVRTGEDGAGGISLLVVEGDTPGLSRTKLEKMGWHASDTAMLYFEDCRVPVANLLGPENSGFKTIVSNFNLERLDLIAGSASFAQLCLEAAIAYAQERPITR